MERIRILCFGDSLTWGYHPVRQDRMGEDERWTGVLQSLLGERYRIIEEGQNSRTIATDDPTEGEKNGLKYIIPCLESQRPLDLMILMLGTNDTKKRYCYSACDIAGEMEQFLEKVQAYNHFHLEGKLKILLVAPPAISSEAAGNTMTDSFDLARSEKIMKELRELYQQLAETYGCDFFDASKVVHVSPVDGVHLDPEEGKKLAEALAERIQAYRF
ncbi:MAG: SGNH/GDSL hydrolase family protein [Lachnospiraceae bacterium]|nr:SGNH/GDSL hydrolase family protein [Lachnospiraceae bacterium]